MTDEIERTRRIRKQLAALHAENQRTTNDAVALTSALEERIRDANGTPIVTTALPVPHHALRG